MFVELILLLLAQLRLDLLKQSDLLKGQAVTFWFVFNHNLLLIMREQRVAGGQCWSNQTQFSLQQVDHFANNVERTEGDVRSEQHPGGFARCLHTRGARSHVHVQGLRQRAQTRQVLVRLLSERELAVVVNQVHNFDSGGARDLRDLDAAEDQVQVSSDGHFRFPCVSARD
ncbi:hypothetical protein D3C71_1345690 [compost metagenome]